MATSTMPVRSTTVPDRAGRRRGANPGRIAAWIAMGIILVITLFPFYWILRTSLSTSRSLFSNPGSLLPVDFTTGAYKRVLGLATVTQAQAEGGSGASVDFVRYLRNSIVFAVVATAGQVFFSALAAYAFARLRWPGRNMVFFAFLTALMVPPIFTALPNFILIKNLGLLNTFPGLIAPYFFMTPFAIFFLRQFFLSISREVEEAAKLDGAGNWRIFFGIVLPMSTAPITTLSILTLINMWNEYLWPLLVATGDNTRVLTVALGVFRSQTPQSGPDWAGLMAGVLVAALPLLIVFLAYNRKDMLTMVKIRKKLGAALVGLATFSLALTACGGSSTNSDSGGGSGGGASGDAIDTSKVGGQLNYWLWDAAQLPAYRSCADAFQKANPGTTIKISQYAYDDYWNN